jgi:type II secretory pathway component PulC
MPAGENHDMTLVGTVVTGGTRLAIIARESTGEQKAFRTGDRLGEITIKEIQPGRVVIQTPKGDEVLALYFNGRDGVPASPPPPAPESDRSGKTELDADLPSGYTDWIKEIRVRPRFAGGKPEGFVIYNIANESVLGKMGIKDGDAILGMNGQPFSTTRPVVEFYEALSGGGKITLSVKRDQGTQELSIQIPESD